MPIQIPITPVYARANLVEMLDAEYNMLLSHVENLTDDQLNWRPNPNAHSIMDILWHLSYQSEPSRPANGEQARERLANWYQQHRDRASRPGSLSESLTWWNGEQIDYKGYLSGFVIRHIAYHYGQVTAIRQAMGIDVAKFYHED